MNDSLENFKKRWSDKCKEIKLESFDSQQAYRIKLEFIVEFRSMLFETQRKDRTFELIKLNNDLDLALQIAYSKYRTEKLKNKCFWSVSLFGNSINKLPQPKI